MNKKSNKKNWDFTIINNAIIHNSKLSIYEKFIYIALCSYKNGKTKKCYPSIKKIATLSGCSPNTVRKALKGLKKKKLISISERKRDKLTLSNLYTLLDIPENILSEYKPHNENSTTSQNEEVAIQTQTVPQNMKEGISEDEGDVLQNMKEGTSENEGDVLQYVKEGTSQIEDKLKQYNYNKKNKNNITIYKKVVDYLNKKANTNYKYTTKKTKQLIKARINEGFVLEDFYKVIDKKCDDWIDTEYEKFIRPQTLFGNKFESYLNQKSRRWSKNYEKAEQYIDKQLKEYGIGL